MAGGFQTSEHAGIRWLNLQNQSKEEMPPYALCMLDKWNTPDDYGWGAFNVDGHAVFRVTRCDQEMEDQQEPYALFFNGPGPIPGNGGQGPGTRDFPAQVLHDGTKDGLRPGMACGPKKDSWEIWSTGSAFTCMGHVSTDFGSNIRGMASIHTVLVDNQRQHTNFPWCGQGGSGSKTVEADKAFILTGGAGIHKMKVHDTSSDKSVEFLVGAKRVFAGFHGTVYAASSVDRGKALTIQMSHKRSGSPRLSYTGMREQNKEEDQYGAMIHLAKENMAIFGQFIDVRKGDRIELKNISSETITILHGSLQVFTLEEGFTRNIEQGGG